MFKTNKDFDGYWVKNISNFKGHDMEPLFQCNVYKDNKKIGFFSQDSWGGPPQLQGFKKEDEKELIEYAKSVDPKPWSESYHTFIAGIVEAIDNRKYFLTRCRTKTLVKLFYHKEEEFYEFNVKFQTDPHKVRKFLNNKYGRGNYTLINDEVKK